MRHLKSIRAPQFAIRAAKFAVVLCSLFAAALATAPAHAEAFLLVDAESGKVLRAENATYPWYPASLTKLMTAYVTLRALKEGRITPNTLFTVSRNAYLQAPVKMGFPIGTPVTVDNALKMMLVKSANDMAVLLAEGVDGSIDNFATDMTATAHRLGMSETNYVNPNGLPADGQITSARDLAILVRAIIRDLPEYNYYFDIPAIKLGRRVVRNYNPLLGRYPGADGMKTGFICASGFNLVATATRNGKRLIAVVLGAPSSSARAIKAAELLESGFTQNPLSWLLPSLGKVDELKPIEASPPNLHEETCGAHRRRPIEDAGDEELEKAGGGSTTEANSFAAVLSALRMPTAHGAALLTEAGPVTPIVVYTGPTRTAAQLAHLANLPPERRAAHRRRKAEATATKEKNKKAPEAKSAEAKAADTKAADTKAEGKEKLRAHTHAWTPTSSASLATSPPTALRTTSVEAHKKRHKVTHPAKPAAATVQ